MLSRIEKITPGTSRYLNSVYFNVSNYFYKNRLTIRSCPWGYNLWSWGFQSTGTQLRRLWWCFYRISPSPLTGRRTPSATSRSHRWSLSRTPGWRGERRNFKCLKLSLQETRVRLGKESVAYTSQGTPPTLTVTSSLVAVSRSSPSMVMTVPPAAGPFAGWTNFGLGSWRERMIHQLIVLKRWESGLSFSHSEVERIQHANDAHL